MYFLFSFEYSVHLRFSLKELLTLSLSHTHTHLHNLFTEGFLLFVICFQLVCRVQNYVRNFSDPYHVIAFKSDHNNFHMEFDRRYAYF